jgi:hypothetical protein
MTRGERRITALATLAMACGTLVWLGAVVSAQVQEMQLPGDVANLTKSKVLEVRDSKGASVLCGQLVTQPIEGNEIEKEAELITCGEASKATGEAEVEITKTDAGIEQEVEVEVLHLAPDATYSIHIDSKLIGTFKTNKSGGAQVEFKTAPAK